MIFKELEASMRCDAIRKLQQKLLKSTLGSYWAQVYEKALNFSLNQSRSVQPNFYYRLIDDAKRTIRRDKKGAPIITSFYIERNEEKRVLEKAYIDDLTPEQILIHKQAMGLLRKACAKKHKFLLPVLNAMISGYTVKETARRLNISTALVKKLRAEIVSIGKRVF